MTRTSPGESGRRGFSPRERLELCFDRRWSCEITGLPLVFPPALCLLERLVSCAGGETPPRAQGYYDKREARWNAPLLALAFPAADHLLAHAKGGATFLGNAQLLAGPVNVAKSDGELAVIPPFDPTRREACEADASRGGQTPFYWPPSSRFSGWSKPEGDARATAVDWD